MSSSSFHNVFWYYLHNLAGITSIQKCYYCNTLQETKVKQKNIQHYNTVHQHTPCQRYVTEHYNTDNHTQLDESQYDQLSLASSSVTCQYCKNTGYLYNHHPSNNDSDTNTTSSSSIVYRYSQKHNDRIHREDLIDLPSIESVSPELPLLIDILKNYEFHQKVQKNHHSTSLPSSSNPFKPTESFILSFFKTLNLSSSSHSLTITTLTRPHPITQFTHLQTLNLSHNHLTIIHYLPPSLSTLILTHNYIDDPGLVYMLENRAIPAGIKRIDIGHNRVGNECMKWWSGIYSGNTSRGTNHSSNHHYMRNLSALDLSYNSITDLQCVLQFITVIQQQCHHHHPHNHNNPDSSSVKTSSSSTITIPLHTIRLQGNPFCLYHYYLPSVLYTFHTSHHTSSQHMLPHTHEDHHHHSTTLSDSHPSGDTRQHITSLQYIDDYPVNTLLSDTMIHNMFTLNDTLFHELCTSTEHRMESHEKSTKKEWDKKTVINRSSVFSHSPSNEKSIQRRDRSRSRDRSVERERHQRSSSSSSASQRSNSRDTKKSVENKKIQKKKDKNSAISDEEQQLMINKQRRIHLYTYIHHLLQHLGHITAAMISSPSSSIHSLYYTPHIVLHIDIPTLTYLPIPWYMQVSTKSGSSSSSHDNDDMLKKKKLENKKLFNQQESKSVKKKQKDQGDQLPPAPYTHSIVNNTTTTTTNDGSHHTAHTTTVCTTMKYTTMYYVTYELPPSNENGDETKKVVGNDKHRKNNDLQSYSTCEISYQPTTIDTENSSVYPLKYTRHHMYPHATVLLRDTLLIHGIEFLLWKKETVETKVDTTVNHVMSSSSGGGSRGPTSSLSTNHVKEKNVSKKLLSPTSNTTSLHTTGDRVLKRGSKRVEQGESMIQPSPAESTTTTTCTTKTSRSVIGRYELDTYGLYKAACMDGAGSHCWTYWSSHQHVPMTPLDDSHTIHHTSKPTAVTGADTSVTASTSDTHTLSSLDGEVDTTEKQAPHLLQQRQLPTLELKVSLNNALIAPLHEIKSSME